MDYRKAIKELREKLRVGQKELAKRLGVSCATVNHWERGRYEPNYKAKRKLRDLFEKNGIVLEGKK